MDMQIKDRVALVTGGTRDVGREIALTLAAEGATVAVHHRSSADEAGAVVAEIHKQGGKAKAYRADIADHAAVQAMIQSIVADHGAGFVGRAAVVDGDGRAFGGKRQRDLAPDIPGAAGDQCDAVLELHVHVCAFLAEGLSQPRFL